MSTDAGQAGQEAVAPLVSIVLPVFNDAGTLKYALDSLLHQDYDNVEILVVDDGSSDDTAEVVRGVASADPRVKFLQTPHAGTSAAKNKGFETSKGDVVFFAEGDALYERDYLKEAIRELHSDPTRGGVCVLGKPLVSRPNFASNCLYTEKLLVHQQIAEGKKGAYFSWIFPRSVLRRVGLYDTTLSQAEDRDLFDRIKSAGYSIGLVRRTLWYHRRDETTGRFLRGILAKSRRRVAYVVKNRRWGELIKGVGGVVFIFIVLIAGILGTAYIFLLTALVIAGLAYRYATVIGLGRRTEATLSGLLMLPVFQVLRYMASSFGYAIGLLEWTLGRRSIIL